MQRKELGAFVLILATLVAAGCKSTNTLEKAYKNYGRFVAIQEATVLFTEDPFVDQDRKVEAATVVVAAKPFADTMYDAAIELALLQEEIVSMKYYGEVVPEQKVLLALQAEQKLKELMLTATPRILESIRLLGSLR